MTSISNDLNNQYTEQHDDCPIPNDQWHQNSHNNLTRRSYHSDFISRRTYCIWKLWQCDIPWCHQMETFSVLLALCARNSPVTSEFPTQRPVAWSLDVFFDLCLNKGLTKQLWGWWSETQSRSLWHHCNDFVMKKELFQHTILKHLITYSLLDVSKLITGLTRRLIAKMMIWYTNQ